MPPLKKNETLDTREEEAIYDMARDKELIM